MRPRTPTCRVEPCFYRGAERAAKKKLVPSRPRKHTTQHCRYGDRGWAHVVIVYCPSASFFFADTGSVGRGRRVICEHLVLKNQPASAGKSPSAAHVCWTSARKTQAILHFVLGCFAHPGAKCKIAWVFPADVQQTRDAHPSTN